ncbi:hypothetical protein Rsub_08068 [Raphidocelis subcapitata]|uniref:STI1/HOP DP domain-containing protein n=1 Tax=Raphidocelis subcapitata TaxID=307507 RepID=A0A2V0PFW2_9CHLO|nr:hypothetical protein Rsub_08068 [Raphidocelis subcapitata]|eukprot:GBF95945.1 hypothetical protein Rsub_08068 [Raphidocelis subcapitata]
MRAAAGASGGSRGCCGIPKPPSAAGRAAGACGAAAPHARSVAAAAAAGGAAAARAPLESSSTGSSNSGSIGYGVASSSGRTALPHMPSAAPRGRRRAAAAGPTAPGGDGFTDALNSMVADLRSDPEIAPLFDDPKISAAIREVAADPSALKRYSGDRRVMAVLGRLMERDMPAAQKAAFSSMGTTPRGALASMASDPELVALLAKPNVRQALADAKADPQRGLERWEGDAEVARALDLLEAALGGVVDVEAD